MDRSGFSVTLNLFIASPWGMWLSSDFRLSDPPYSRGGPWRPRGDYWSPKLINVTAPDGRMDITYTGVGQVHAANEAWEHGDEVPSWLAEVNGQAGKLRVMDVSEWVAWALHGETRSIGGSIERIRTEA